MVTYLKAIGNIGPVSQKIEDVLLLLAQCKAKALPIRVAAIDALRFRQCSTAASQFSQVKVMHGLSFIPHFLIMRSMA